MSESDLLVGAPIAGLLFLAAACVLFSIEGRRNGPTLASQPASVPPEPWPRLWLFVRAWKLNTVRLALGLQNPKPCSCRCGLSRSTEGLFVAQAPNGWALVTGTALPEPSEDVDGCFRLVRGLSHKLGQVQLFWADSAQGQHGWVKAKRGRIIRAYAWAGRTLWNQGPMTREEKALGLQCFDYAADPEFLSLEPADVVQSNCRKVTQLAAAWGLGWSNLEEFVSGNGCGISGNPAKEF